MFKRLKGEVEMIRRYAVVQKYENGVWSNFSCRFFLRGIKGALLEYDYQRRKNPDQRFRIAKGQADFNIK